MKDGESGNKSRDGVVNYFPFSSEFGRFLTLVELHEGELLLFYLPRHIRLGVFGQGPLGTVEWSRLKRSWPVLNMPLRGLSTIVPYASQDFSCKNTTLVGLPFCFIKTLVYGKTRVRINTCNPVRSVNLQR